MFGKLANAESVGNAAYPLDAAVAEAIEDERTQVRRELVDGRLTGLERRMGAVEGAVAGTDAKLDALLDAQLGTKRAGEVRESAAAVAAKTEADSGG